MLGAWLGWTSPGRYSPRVKKRWRMSFWLVATRKDPRLVSNKLLIARPMDPRGKPEGNYLVAVDTVDAGVGETVLIVSGSSARMAAGMKDTPVDAAIVGIIDTVDLSE